MNDWIEVGGTDNGKLAIWKERNNGTVMCPISIMTLAAGANPGAMGGERIIKSTVLNPSKSIGGCQTA